MANRNFAVGVFVSFAIIVFIGATLWLTGREGSEPTVEYSMFFEKEVSGLMLGGPVYYLGVNVGSVTSMDIIPGNPMRVRVNARVLESAPINAGTYAGLALQGITGVAVIKLNADPGEHGELALDPDSGFPIIPVRPVGFSAILSKAPELIDKMDGVLDHLDQLLGDENQQRVETILTDISKTTSALASSESSIAEIPGLLRQTIDELRAGIAQVRELAASVEPGLDATLANLEEVTANLVETTGRIESWAVDNDADMDAFMGDGLGNVPALISEARAAIREIDKLVTELKEDPSRLVYKPKDNSIDPEQ